MGVYIKNIDIPEIKRGVAAIINIDDILFFKTADDIVLVPDHGDLIEKPILIDELAISEEPDDCRGCVSYNSYDDFCCCSLDFQNMCRSIRTAPVVIPAERSKENDRKNHN